jgi:hypothetical protein
MRQLLQKRRIRANVKSSRSNGDTVRTPPRARARRATHVAMAAVYLAANWRRIAAHGVLRVLNLIGRKFEGTGLTRALQTPA